MKLRVVDNHEGEGKFPLFAKGTAVGDLVPCKNTPHWLSCVINGHNTYIPDTFVVNGALARDYDPTELMLEAGQVVALVEVVFEWLYVEDEEGKRGWLPAEKVVSLTWFEIVEGWVKRNARPLEVAKWDFIFGNGSKEAILSELLKFQNADGGFGNGLEPDLILPHSNSITSAEAIFTASKYGLDCTGDWFARLLDCFENSVQNIPRFWEAVPKEVEDYPRPPWWNYGSDDKFSPNPCAVIAAALILHGTKTQKQLGLTVAHKCFEFLLSDEFCGDHDSYCLILLVEKLHAAGSDLITDDILSAMKQKIKANVCYDESKWHKYHPQPLNFAHSPISMWHDCVEEGIENNLKYWMVTTNDDGVWKPHFSWGVDSEAARQATKNWMGAIAVGRMTILRDYGVI